MEGCPPLDAAVHIIPGVLTVLNDSGVELRSTPFEVNTFDILLLPIPDLVVGDIAFMGSVLPWKIDIFRLGWLSLPKVAGMVVERPILASGEVMLEGCCGCVRSYLRGRRLLESKTAAFDHNFQCGQHMCTKSGKISENRIQRMRLPWFLLLVVVVALAVGQQPGDETCHQDGTCRKEEPGASGSRFRSYQKGFYFCERISQPPERVSSLLLTRRGAVIC